jgi:hypothetical protein
MFQTAGWVKPMPAQPFGMRAVQPAAVASRWPPFSSWLLLALIVAKPLSDALYEIDAVKYLYILLLAAGALLARVGRAFAGDGVDSRNRSLVAYVFLLVAYFYYLFGGALAHGGSLSAIFKIVSPFAFFVLVAFANDRWLIHALAAAAVLAIVVNAALLPFDFGWTQWGSVRTFKGYYFFKTDLAYALVFSLLVAALYFRNRITPLLGTLMLLAAVQVLFANSRLNYLTLIGVFLFLGIKQGLGARVLLGYGAAVAALGAVAIMAIDPSQLLGFDTSDMRSFSQGRSDIWASLWTGMQNSTPREWLFGQGFFADSRLMAEHSRAGQDIHNAHNELLHLLATQGIVGLCAYVGLWVWMYRMCRPSHMPAWARGTLLTAVLVFLFQGVTTVMSPFATKTWPLVMVFLAVRCLGYGGQETPRAAPC